MKLRRYFAAYRRERRAVKRIYFVGWRKYWKTEKMYIFQVIGKPFLAWKDEIQETKELNKLVSRFFKLSIERYRLTPQAVMCYFNVNISFYLFNFISFCI